VILHDQHQFELA